MTSVTGKIAVLTDLNPVSSPSQTEPKDEMVQEPGKESAISTRDIEVFDPLSIPSTHEDYNLGSLLPDVISRMCFWLDSGSICRFARVSRQHFLGVMGLKSAREVLSPESLKSFIGEELTVENPMEGYNLRGRIDRVCDLVIRDMEDLANKHEPGDGHTIRERFLQFLPKELANCEELQGAHFSRLFNLLVNGEADASFSRPATGLTEPQKQKIKQVEQDYLKLNNLLFSLLMRFSSIAFDHAEHVPFAELKPTYVGFINELKENGDKQLKNSVIEQMVLQLNSFCFNAIPRSSPREEEEFEIIQEAYTYLLIELVRLELAKLSPQEVTQLANTLQETFDVVKPLYSMLMKNLTREEKAVAQPAPPIQAPSPSSWKWTAARQILYVCGSVGSGLFLATTEHLTEAVSPSWQPFFATVSAVVIYVQLNLYTYA